MKIVNNMSITTLDGERISQDCKIDIFERKIRRFDK